MTSGSPVTTAVSGGVAQVVLNRPEKRNALDVATLSALGAALAQCAADVEVRVVQLTGAGNVFCAGADLKEWLELYSPSIRPSHCVVEMSPSSLFECCLSKDLFFGDWFCFRVGGLMVGRGRAWMGRVWEL